MKSKINLSLKEKLLIYIHYILPKRKFKLSHKHIQTTLYKVDHKKYSLGTLHKELSILRSRGLLTHKLRYRKKVPILSLDGKLFITPILAYKSFGDWDGKWRVVIIKPPREERKYQLELTAKMIEIGFKKILRGAYITPHPFLSTVDRLSTYLGIRQYCLLLETDNLYKQNIIADQIWDLQKINKQYKQFIALTNNLLKRLTRHLRGGRTDSSEAKEVSVSREINTKRDEICLFRAKILEKTFCDIYARDPHLPAQFLPKPWHAQTAYNLYRHLISLQ